MHWSHAKTTIYNFISLPCQFLTKTWTWKVLTKLNQRNGILIFIFLSFFLSRTRLLFSNKLPVYYFLWLMYFLLNSRTYFNKHVAVVFPCQNVFDAQWSIQSIISFNKLAQHFWSERKIPLLKVNKYNVFGSPNKALLNFQSVSYVVDHFTPNMLHVIRSENGKIPEKLRKLHVTINRDRSLPLNRTWNFPTFPVNSCSLRHVLLAVGELSSINNASKAWRVFWIYKFIITHFGLEGYR